MSSAEETAAQATLAPEAEASAPPAAPEKDDVEAAVENENDDENDDDENDEDDENDGDAEGGAKKKKNKKKNKKTPVAADTEVKSEDTPKTNNVETKAPAPKAPEPKKVVEEPKPKKVVEQPKKAPTPPPQVPEEPEDDLSGFEEVASKSKKKKNKKKNKKAATQAEQPEPKAAEQPKKAAEQPKKAAEQPKKAEEKPVEDNSAAAEAEAAAAAAAAAAVAEAEAAETGWKTVPARRNKKKAAAVPVVTAEEVPVAPEDAAPNKIAVQLDIGEYAPKLIGPGGQTIQSLQESSGAKVDLDRATKTCTISGTQEQVAAAQEFVMTLLANQKKDFLDLGAKRGLVFAKLREIQDASGARLDLERDSNLLELSGEVAQVVKAREMVSAILDSTSVNTIDLALRDVPCVIGKAGANVKVIQADSGASLDIDSDIGIVSVTGTPQQVARATELVRLFVEHRGPPPEALKKLQMPGQDARLVIGAGGANVQRLEKETGARIKIDLDGDDGAASVTVSGSSAEVEAGVAAVNKLIADHSNEASVPVANSSIFKAILGSGGATINSIRDKSRARVDLSDAGVSIKGTPDQVAKARKMVEEIIQAEVGPPKVPEGQTLFETDLGAATGRVIGAGGSNIARLQGDCNVTINIKRGTYCYVVGPQEGVDKAKAEIMDTLKRHEEAVAKAKAREEEAARLAAESKAKEEEEQQAREAAAAEAGEDIEEAPSAAEIAAKAPQPVAPAQVAKPAAAQAAAAPTQAVPATDNQAWQPPPSTWGANDAWGSTSNANGSQNGWGL